jgi:ABC-2 type transport system permease protein
MKSGNQALVVLGAQLRMYRNLLGRRGAGATVFNFVATGVWYLFALFLAYVAAGFFSSIGDLRLMMRVLVIVLFGVTAYWQLAPILTVSFGLALDLKRLLIFPIRPNQYFLIELLLCLPTSIEALCITLGVMVGLMLNPAVNGLLVLATGLLFLAFNLFLNVALRALVAKVAVKRIWRELVLFFFLMVLITPQFVLTTQNDDKNWLERLTAFDSHNVLPWSAAANAFTGMEMPASLVTAGIWTLVALAGARGLFFRSLHAEAESQPEKPKVEATVRAQADVRARMASLLGRPFPEPLASLVEKEFLTFMRSPRFLTVFVMGFTFGIVVFLPMALNAGDGSGFVPRNFLTVVTAYAILLMSETAFWNIFGLDRRAAQVFFFAPVSLQMVFAAKNIVSFFIIGVQVFVISLVCALIGVPVTLAGVLEALVAAIVLTINMFAVGNQSSVRYPAGVNPDQSWNTANKAKFRIVLMLLFPIVSLPTTLAYLARWAFNSDLAFYAGMGVSALIAVIFYMVSLDSAIEYARARREHLVDLLGSTETAG